MSEPGELISNEKLHEIILDTIEKDSPVQTRKNDFRRRIYSGKPKDVYGRCGYGGSVSVANKLSSLLGTDIQSGASSHKNMNGHVYLVSPESDLIIDPTAGQFIPLSSRVGYDNCFIGNMFIGKRKILKEIALKGVINTRTKQNPLLSFQRIWGDKSVLRGPSEKSSSKVNLQSS